MGAFYRQISNLYMLTIPGTVFCRKKKAPAACWEASTGLLIIYTCSKFQERPFCRKKKTPAACSEASTGFLKSTKFRYSPLFAAICRYIHCNIRRYSPLIPPKIGSHRWQPNILCFYTSWYVFCKYDLSSSHDHHCNHRIEFLCKGPVRMRRDVVP